MKPILYVNHVGTACGVYQFGKRVYELLENSSHDFIYVEVDSLEKYNSIVDKLDIDYIVYNWHRGTMPWLTEDIINKDKKHKHYFLFHEEFIFNSYDKYLFFGDYDINNKLVSKEKSILLPRPLLQYNGEYKQNSKLTIGTFGFAFWNKGIHILTKLVNDTMNNVELRFHLPKAEFSDPTDEQSLAVIKQCKRYLTNKSISLNISREFLSEDKILEFLAGNDINVFMYEENGEGISSVIDYALSVKRPIAVRYCQMFRHILKNDVVITDTNSILDIYNRGISPLDEFYTKWNISNFIKEMDKVFYEESNTN